MLFRSLGESVCNGRKHSLRLRQVGVVSLTEEARQGKALLLDQLSERVRDRALSRAGLAMKPEDGTLVRGALGPIEYIVLQFLPSPFETDASRIEMSTIECL